MMEDHSIEPLINGLIGGFIALLTITLPVVIVCLPIQYTIVEKNVKINNNVNQS